MEFLLAGVAPEQAQRLHAGVASPNDHRVKMPGRQPAVDLSVGPNMERGELLRGQAQEGAKTVLHAQGRESSGCEQDDFGSVNESLARGDPMHFTSHIFNATPLGSEECSAELDRRLGRTEGHRRAPSRFIPSAARMLKKGTTRMKYCGKVGSGIARNRARPATSQPHNRSSRLRCSSLSPGLGGTVSATAASSISNKARDEFSQ